MNDLDSAATRSPAAYHCPTCSRCFIALGISPGREILCICGASLTVRTLSRGIYELRSAEPFENRVTEPKRTPKEVDLGYGESHGYGAAHGGPTGPGDAPAGPEEGAKEPPRGLDHRHP